MFQEAAANACGMVVLAVTRQKWGQWSIATMAGEPLSNPAAYEAIAIAANPFGDGQAAAHIRQI